MIPTVEEGCLEGLPDRPKLRGTVEFEPDGSLTVATMQALTRYLRESSRWMDLVVVSCAPKENTP